MDVRVDCDHSGGRPRSGEDRPYTRHVRSPASGARSGEDPRTAIAEFLAAPLVPASLLVLAEIGNYAGKDM